MLLGLIYWVWFFLMKRIKRIWDKQTDKKMRQREYSKKISPVQKLDSTNGRYFKPAIVPDKEMNLNIKRHTMFQGNLVFNDQCSCSLYNLQNTSTHKIPGNTKWNNNIIFFQYSKEERLKLYLPKGEWMENSKTILDRYSQQQIKRSNTTYNIQEPFWEKSLKCLTTYEIQLVKM